MANDILDETGASPQLGRDKLSFEWMRSPLPDARIARIHGERQTGRYARFGRGARDVLRDAAQSVWVADFGAEQRFNKPHCPWINGKIERLNRATASRNQVIDPAQSNRSANTVAGIRASCDNNSRIRGSRSLTPEERPTPPYLDGFSDLIAFATVFRAIPNR